MIVWKREPARRRHEKWENTKRIGKSRGEERSIVPMIPLIPVFRLNFSWALRLCLQFYGLLLSFLRPFSLLFGQPPLNSLVSLVFCHNELGSGVCNASFLGRHFDAFAISGYHIDEGLAFLCYFEGTFVGTNL
jgi:hypothetical protein